MVNPKMNELEWRDISELPMENVLLLGDFGKRTALCWYSNGEWLKFGKKIHPQKALPAIGLVRWSYIPAILV